MRGGDWQRHLTMVERWKSFCRYDAVGKSFSIFLPIPFWVYKERDEEWDGDGDLVRADFFSFRLGCDGRLVFSPVLEERLTIL